MSPSNTFTIAIAGNPNCGKTALFNALTGARQHVGNWPGVTVEKKEGYLDLGGRQIRVVDIPGTYALFANAEDERAAVDYLLSREANLIINIIDATNIERNLFLTSQIADMHLPMVMAVNMMDIAEQRGLNLDLEKLSEEYGVPCIPLSAVSDRSVVNFISEMGRILSSTVSAPKAMQYSEKVEAAIKYLEPIVAPVAKILDTDSRWVSLMYLGNEKSYADKFAAAGVQIDKSKITEMLGEESEFAMADERYSKAHEVAQQVIASNRSKKTFSDVIDSIALNRWAALPVFLVVMYLVFWVAVTIGNAFIDFFDILFGAIFVDGLGYLLSNVMGCPDVVSAILASGIGTGIQSVSTFIPVIFFMFLCLSFLEDSGYMARAAFVSDRFMRFLGLPGRAFVPMMVGFGCGVPGIMGSRVLESKRERFLTIFLVPFMSCGARLPVYALFAAAFFGAQAGTVVFAIYLAGILFAVVYGITLRHSLFQGQASNFVMELPPYHMPKPKSLLIHSWQRLREYIIRAGKVITLAVALVGILNAFGVVDKMYTEINGEKTEIVQTDDGYAMVQENKDGESEEVALPEGFTVDESKIEKTTEFAIVEDGDQNSFLSIAGKAVTPLFEPFGVEADNWPASVSLFTGLLAKEAVVGTMNSLYAMSGNKDAAEVPAEEAPKAESTTPVVVSPKAIEAPVAVAAPAEAPAEAAAAPTPETEVAAAADSAKADSAVAPVADSAAPAAETAAEAPAEEEKVLIVGVDECPAAEEEEEEGAPSISSAFMEALATIPDNLSGVFESLLDPLGTSGELEAQGAADIKQLTLAKIQDAKVVTCDEYAAFEDFAAAEDESDEDAVKAAKEAEALRESGLAKLAAAGVTISEDEMAAMEEGDLEETADIYANMRSYFHNPDKNGNPVDGFNWQVFAFLIFVLLYVPCLAAMGVVVQEIGLGLGILMAVLQTIIAWAVAILLYQIPVGGDTKWIVTAIISLIAVFIFLKLFGKKANKEKRFED